RRVGPHGSSNALSPEQQPRRSARFNDKSLQRTPPVFLSHAGQDNGLLFVASPLLNGAQFYRAVRIAFTLLFVLRIKHTCPNSDKPMKPIHAIILSNYFDILPCSGHPRAWLANGARRRSSDLSAVD